MKQNFGHFTLAILFTASIVQARSPSYVERYRIIIKKATEPEEECDRRHATKVFALLESLQKQNINLKNIKLPPRKKSEKINPTSGSEKSYLVTRYEGWEKAILLFKRIKKTTPQNNPVDWFNLTSYVEHLLFHDHLRIVESANYQLDYSVATFGPIAYQEVRSCLVDSTCKQLNLTQEIQEMLNQKERYKYSWQAYRSGAEEERRIWIGLLEYHLGADLKLLAFSPNPTVERVGKNIILPLDAGDFHDKKAIIEKAVSENWNDAKGIEVKIKWSTKDEENPEVYKLVRSSQIQGRAHVDEEQALVFLNETLTNSEIAHEIGHTLGFRDHYYRSWEPATCLYKDEMDRSDLMSFPESGRVTKSEWLIIDQAYPEIP